MPAQAAAMQPFLAQLPSLDLAGRAMAVHFGHFPSGVRPFASAQGTQMASLAPTVSGQAGRPDNAPARAGGSGSCDKPGRTGCGRAHAAAPSGRRAANRHRPDCLPHACAQAPPRVRRAARRAFAGPIPSPPRSGRKDYLPADAQPAPAPASVQPRTPTPTRRRTSHCRRRDRGRRLHRRRARPP